MEQQFKPRENVPMFKVHLTGPYPLEYPTPSLRTKRDSRKKKIFEPGKTSGPMMVVVCLIPFGLTFFILHLGCSTAGSIIIASVVAVGAEVFYLGRICAVDEVVMPTKAPIQEPETVPDIVEKKLTG